MNLLIECIGVVVFLYAHFLTDGNPIIMGITVFAILMLGENKTEGGYSPLVTSAKYLMGRLTLNDTLYLLAVQFAAMGAIVVTFSPMKTLIDSI
jgi:hypothetical protein